MCGADRLVSGGPCCPGHSKSSGRSGTCRSDAKAPAPYSWHPPTLQEGPLTGHGGGLSPVRMHGAHPHVCFVFPAGRSFQNLPVREAANQSSGHRGSRGLQPCHSESRPQAPPPAPCGPRPKPKTVSELLREKRLREARARKAAPGTVALPPQLLLSSPLILQPHLPQASPTPSASGPAATATALSGPGIPAATGLSTSAKDERPSTLPVLARALTSTEAPAASTALVPSQVLVSGHQGGLGQSQAPAASRKQGLPEAPLFLPAAPSPVQLPVQPLSLTPALGMHKGGAHVVASTPLPVTWVLTAQGLLPVPAVVGLPGPAGTSDPKGLSVTLPPSLPGMQVGQGPKPPGLSHPWQPPANMDTDSDPPSRTDFSTLPMLCPSQISVEVGSDVALAPGGPPFPGGAQVASEISVPRIPSQATLLADHPEAKPPWSSQPPLQADTDPGSGPGGTPGSPGSGGLTGPLSLERPPPPRPGPERCALDLDLLSQESEAAVREWLRGQQGVCVPPLGSRLPYQPPALCSLRALSGLLLHKKALEQRATSLVPCGAAGALQALLGQVQRQLQDSPAYLLLKARFLAAFTLPALLATLSPHGVPTTLSVTTRADPESEDDLGEVELVGDCSTSGLQARPAATIPVQVGGRGHRAPAPSAASPPSCGWEFQPVGLARWLRRRRKLAPGLLSLCGCGSPLRPVWKTEEGTSTVTKPLGPSCGHRHGHAALPEREWVISGPVHPTHTPALGHQLRGGGPEFVPARLGTPILPAVSWYHGPQKSILSHGGNTTFLIPWQEARYKHTGRCPHVLWLCALMELPASCPLTLLLRPAGEPGHHIVCHVRETVGSPAGGGHSPAGTRLCAGRTAEAVFVARGWGREELPVPCPCV